MEIKKIETYSLYEFCQAVEQSVIDGWRFDFESNELFPIAYGSMLVTGMVKKPKDTVQQATEFNTEETPAVNAQDNQVKRARKSKE